MAEKPILFSAPMVNAILSGRKFQTRRVIKPQPPSNFRLWGKPIDNHFAWTDHPTQGEKGQVINLDCPISIGDTLWVRETYAMYTVGGETLPVYRADSYPDGDGTPWKPSIFMPRALSRITLRVTNVRAQRVQDISEDDAAAEGIERHSGPYILDFARLWDSINGSRGWGWGVNPWVWVISFERIAS